MIDSFILNNMKRFRFLLMLTLGVLLLAACEPDPSFEASQLVGKWKNGTEYWRYDSNFSGATWDTGDDVTEAEAQPFTWTLEGDQLTQLHQMEMGGVVPKVYTITALSASSLTYKDNYNQSFTFTRVQ